MNHDPAFTTERLEALEQVNLRLMGVAHGDPQEIDGIHRVTGCNDEDYDLLLEAANELRIERGDAMAVEPTGFKSLAVDELRIASILSAKLPDVPVSDMSLELRNDIAETIEVWRAERLINNLAYVATHVLLKGIPLYRAEISLEDWEMLKKLLPNLAPEDQHDELRSYYRNTKMLARIGDAAIDLTANKARRADDDKPGLLFASGLFHTPRLKKRLDAHNVSYTSNL